jgi:hypothetical protein
VLFRVRDSGRILASFLVALVRAAIRLGALIMRFGPNTLLVPFLVATLLRIIFLLMLLACPLLVLDLLLGDAANGKPEMAVKTAQYA